MLNYKKIQDLQIKLEKAQQRLTNKLEKFEELKKDGKLMQKKFKDYRTNGIGWEDTSDEDLKKAIIRNFQIFDVDQAECYVNELERKLERLMKTWKEEEPQRLAKEAKDNEKAKAINEVKGFIRPFIDMNLKRIINFAFKRKITIGQSINNFSDDVLANLLSIRERVQKYGKILGLDLYNKDLDNGYIGIVHCEKKDVEFRVILAGGYNIQCLHTRFILGNVTL